MQGQRNMDTFEVIIGWWVSDTDSWTCVFLNEVNVRKKQEKYKMFYYRRIFVLFTVLVTLKDLHWIKSVGNLLGKKIKINEKYEPQTNCMSNKRRALWKTVKQWFILRMALVRFLKQKHFFGEYLRTMRLRFVFNQMYRWFDALNEFVSNTRLTLAEKRTSFEHKSYENNFIYSLSTHTSI